MGLFPQFVRKYNHFYLIFKQNSQNTCGILIFSLIFAASYVVSSAVSYQSITSRESMSMTKKLGNDIPVDTKKRILYINTMECINIFNMHSLIFFDI